MPRVDSDPNRPRAPKSEDQTKAKGDTVGGASIQTAGGASTSDETPSQPGFGKAKSLALGIAGGVFTGVMLSPRSSSNVNVQSVPSTTSQAPVCSPYSGPPLAQPQCPVDTAPTDTVTVTPTYASPTCASSRSTAAMLSREDPATQQDDSKND